MTERGRAEEVRALADAAERGKRMLPMAAALRQFADLLERQDGSHPRSCDWWEGGLCGCGVQDALDRQEARCAPLVQAMTEAGVLISRDLPKHAMDVLEDALNAHRDQEGEFLRGSGNWSKGDD